MFTTYRPPRGEEKRALQTATMTLATTADFLGYVHKWPLFFGFFSCCCCHGCDLLSFSKCFVASRINDAMYVDSPCWRDNTKVYISDIVCTMRYIPNIACDLFV